jgi:nucleotide-binding universal stress UspA family protein
MRVLVCIDLSLLTQAVADEAEKIAKMTGASLSLLHVVKVAQRPDVDGLEPPEDMAYRVEQVQAIATRLRHGGATVEADVKLTSGAVHELVLAEAVRTSANVIVIGSNSRSRTYELFIGSTTQHVIHGALCPVVVINGLRSVGGPG